MIFAYGYTAQRSRLTIRPEPPVRPVETTIAEVPVTTTPPQIAMLTTATTVAEPEPIPPTTTASLGVSILPWLITLVLCTGGLVGLGALLMASLTRPGRHERLLGGDHVRRHLDIDPVRVR